ncbi:MAG: hypothetical protein Q9166_006009 [cf. Caloplaca sp. 2 TL-2023]
MFTAPILLAIVSTLSFTSAKTLTSILTSTATATIVIVSNSSLQTSSLIADLQGDQSALTANSRYISYDSILATAVLGARLDTTEIDETQFTSTAV